MKKMVWLLWLLLIAVPIAFPLSLGATIIGDVTLQEFYSAPTGYVTFPSPTGYGNYYLDYDASLNGGSLVESFCVENSNGPSGPQPYTLLSLDNTLSAFGLDPIRYLAAAWIAEYYFANYKATDTAEAWKAGAQIAIWEIIFDYSNGLNLISGDFQSKVYNTEAAVFLNALPSILPPSISNWALAVSPPVSVGDQVTVTNYQNYLVPVPEPLTLVLLGLGLVGVAGFRRKIRK